MRAGLLNEVVEVWNPQTVINEFGQQETDYILGYRTRARLIHNSGNRNIENDEVVFNYSKTFELRHYIIIDELDRIKWNGRFYRILDIEPSKQEMKLIINCELINE